MCVVCTMHTCISSLTDGTSAVLNVMCSVIGSSVSVGAVWRKKEKKRTQFYSESVSMSLNEANHDRHH